MIKIMTERLIIDNFVEEDWKGLKNIILQYEDSPFAFYDHKWPTSDDELKRIVRWFANEDSFLAVRFKDSNDLIGYVSLNAMENSNEYNIGYCFDFNLHNKGYATESCQAVINHAFTTLNAEKIVSGTANDNTPSCKLLLRLGMRKISEGVCSFRKHTDGKPIEFISSNYALERINWLSNSGQKS